MMVSRRFFLSWLCCALALSAVSCGVLGKDRGPTKAGSVRVMTYNIHIGRGLDNELDLERIADVIERQSPDLVALQEVDVLADRSGRVDQAKELGRLTGMHVYFGKAIDRSGGAYGQAILSRWPIAEAKTHVLPGRPERETRVCVEVRVRAPGIGRLRFLGAHLDHLPDESDRVRQATYINELLKADPQVPTILAGDLNAMPESDAMLRFFEFWNNVSGGTDEPTFPAPYPTRRIDYVLVPKDQPWRRDSHRVVRELIASDHRPVVVELDWRGR